MLSHGLSRREFLALSCLAISESAGSWVTNVSPAGPHPTPRPGIDASRVLKEAEVQGGGNVIAAFNDVRQIPQIVDGIRCHCGCADSPGYYSLLTCYEGPHAMAQMCDLCQGQGRYAFRLHRAGRSLQDIRAAIDARYGS